MVEMGDGTIVQKQNVDCICSRNTNMKIQLETKHLVIFESALFRTTISLIIEQNHLILVDPNWFPIELQFIQDYISKIAPDKEKYLFFTHSDYDHIIGFNFFKGYKTIASRNFIQQKAKQDILEKIATIDDDNYTKRTYKVEFPSIDIVIEKAQSNLLIGPKEYQVGYILGHNDDSIYLLDPDRKILVAGDYLSNIEFPYLYHSYKEYIKSLEILSSLIETGRVETLIPGHGDYTTSRAGMKQRVEASFDYLNQLKDHCDGQQEFDFSKYVKRFDFPRVMKKFHEGNVGLFRKEFAV